MTFGRVDELLEDVPRMEAEIERLQQRVAELEKIESAARNLIKVKGRHHTELAMKALIEAVNSPPF